MNGETLQIGPDDPRLTAFALDETAGLSQSEQIAIEKALVRDPELLTEVEASQAVARRIAVTLAQDATAAALGAGTLTAAQRATIQAEAEQKPSRGRFARWCDARAKVGSRWQWRSGDRWPSRQQWLTFGLSCTAIAFMLVIPVSRYTNARIRSEIKIARFMDAGGWGAMTGSRSRVSESALDRIEAQWYVPPLSDFLLHQDRAESATVQQAGTTRRSNLTLTPAPPAASSGSQYEAQAPGDNRSLAEAEAAEAAAATAPEAESSLGSARRIIKDGSLVLEVSQVDQAASQVETLAVQMGGYVIESRNSLASDGNSRSSLRIAVPVEQFERAHRRIQALALRILDDQTSGVDVSEEYVDLESELANLEATEAQVRAFLLQSSSVEESLKVNARLTEISGEIALRKGRLKYLAERTAFSTISIALQAPAPKPRPTPVSGWSASRSATQALAAQLGLMQNLADSLIWAAILGGPYLALAAAAGLVFAWQRRRRQGAA